MSEKRPDIIRGVLIQFAGGRLLLPNATISEVLSYSEPEPVDGTPDWLLGRIRWRGWQLPLVAYGLLTGLAEDVGTLGSKVIVLKALGEDARRPYFALLTQGFPRLVTVTEKALGIGLRPQVLADPQAVEAGAEQADSTDGMPVDGASADEAGETIDALDTEAVSADAPPPQDAEPPQERLPPTVLARLRLNEDEALLPDLLALERAVSAVMDYAQADAGA